METLDALPGSTSDLISSTCSSGNVTVIFSVPYQLPYFATLPADCGLASVESSGADIRSVACLVAGDHAAPVADRRAKRRGVWEACVELGGDLVFAAGQHRK